MINIKYLFLLALVNIGCANTRQATLHIIPQPVSLTTQAGTFSLNKKTVIVVSDEGDQRAANFFNDYLQQFYGFKLDIDRQESKNYIRLVTRKFIKAPDKDAYQFTVTKEGITIEGDTYAGTFYGIQTLIQLLPPTNVQRPSANTSYTIPNLSIADYPRFSYRGMHLDVCRHFFPISFIKKYIDYIALHKMNYFHWHLTDDQGWRIEIKKYPNLTNTGGWRNGTIIGRYPGTGNDNIRYGGFYSQEEIKEIVKYAADRHITVVPEIEMPGHSSAAIASYPWLSCFPEKPTIIPSHPSLASSLVANAPREEGLTKNKKLVQETWGVFEDVFCAGKDSTFLFLEGVMDEVLELFPSKYIHVGGDESPKTHWKKCPNCQARIKKEGLKDEHELQSYFIQRMEKFLNAKGRVLIGWDEILEGGLAPNAVVMSWQGEKGGIDAAKEKHDVIMTPGSHCYFDHSQTRNEDSLVIGGYTPVEKVYSYEPVPKELNEQQGKYILGAQANLWTEYIAYPSKVEYMIFPRMSAMSEVLWSPKEKRNWSDFENRLQTQFRRYETWEATYSKAYFDVKVSIVPAPDNNGLRIVAEPRDKQGVLKYSVAGQTKNYTAPFTVTESGPLAMQYFRTNKLVNDVRLSFTFNKATGKKITISQPPEGRYPGQGGAFSLVNGTWSMKGLSHPDWLGWIGHDIEAVIDLGKNESFSQLRLHTLDQNGSWVYLPKYVEVWISDDGKKYTAVGKSGTFVKDTLTMGWITVNFPKQSARFVKVIAPNYGLIPDGQPGAGNKAWVFSDEIQIY